MILVPSALLSPAYYEYIPYARSQTQTHFVHSLVSPHGACFFFFGFKELACA